MRSLLSAAPGGLSRRLSGCLPHLPVRGMLSVFARALPGLFESLRSSLAARTPRARQNAPQRAPEGGRGRAARSACSGAAPGRPEGLSGAVVTEAAGVRAAPLPSGHSETFRSGVKGSLRRYAPLTPDRQRSDLATTGSAALSGHRRGHGLPPRAQP